MESVAEKFSDSIPLFGNSYDIIKELTIYSLLGDCLKENIIKVGSAVVDTRVNVGFPLRPGYGKSVPKNVVIKYLSKLGKRVTIPTSLHPEQLVGKTIIIRDKSGNIIDKKVNYGHLADDYLIFDEAVELISSKEFTQARDYVNLALDTIGMNTIVKRSVDSEVEDAVKYNPKCSMMFLFHPVPLGDMLVTRGFLRRVFIGYVHPSSIERRNALIESLSKSNDINYELLNLMAYLTSRSWNWKFESINPIVDYCCKIADSDYTEKLELFIDMMFFTLRDRLMKLSAIESACRQRDVITSSDISIAFKELEKFMSSQCAYIEENVSLRVDLLMTGKKRKEEIIKYLYKCGAISEHTSVVTVNNVLNDVSKSLGCSKTSVKFYLRQLLYEGIVKAKLVDDKHKVWLCLPLLSEKETKMLER